MERKATKARDSARYDHFGGRQDIEMKIAPGFAPGLLCAFGGGLVNWGIGKAGTTCRAPTGIAARAKRVSPHDGEVQRLRGGKREDAGVPTWLG